jgi:flagellar assembly protein FliH
MSGYIPKEQLDAYRHWQVDSFDPPKPEPEPHEPAPPLDAAAEEVVSTLGLPTAEDIERMHEQAYQEGYQAGYEEGRQEGLRAGLEAALAEAQRIAALGDNIEAALASVDQAVADQLLALALETAKQVLRTTLAVRPEALIPVVREAIAALPLHHGHVALHINPADGEMVREHLGEHFLQSGWRIIEDREVTAGGCLIQAGSSEVDATLETRWKRVLEAIGANPADWLERP